MKFGQVPTKCTTKSSGKPNEWCMRCWYEFNKLAADEDPPTRKCVACGVLHLQK